MKNVKAKKWFGQHFLTNDQVAFDIVDSVSNIAFDGKILEIGPGMGVLTSKLLDTYKERLHVCEIDTESVIYLKKHFPSLSDRIIAGDFLQKDLNPILGQQQSILIGNFPYNISSQILFKLYDHRDQFIACSGMFQKEVAQRIAAAPGQRDGGILSVLLHVFYDVEYLFSVQEQDFDPPPKVKSGVIRLTRNKTKELPFDHDWFKSVVKQAFSQRRKTIRNAFKGSLFHVDWEQNGLAGQRAEQLTLDDFYTLCRSISPSKKKS